MNGRDRAAGPRAQTRAGGVAARQRAPAERDAPQRSDGEQQGNGAQQKQGRSIAEWISLGISALLVLGVIGFVSFLHFTGPDTAVLLEVEPKLDEVYRGSDAYYLPVEIMNVGTETAENARVKVTLTDPQGGRETGDFEIQFLAGQATHRGVVAFKSDPTRGEVTAEAISFLKP